LAESKPYLAFSSGVSVLLPILQLSSSAGSRMHQNRVFSFTRTIFDAVFFRAADYPWYASYCHGMQVMMPVFDDDFPINYSKMQQVTLWNVM